MSGVRWKQRFQNYSRALNLLRSALEEKSLEAVSERYVAALLAAHGWLAGRLDE